MARNNYSYEKRKRELDKKKKKEAKKKKKENKSNEQPVAFDEFGLPIEAPEVSEESSEADTEEET